PDGETGLPESSQEWHSSNRAGTDGSCSAYLEDRLGAPVGRGERLLGRPEMAPVATESGASRARATPEWAGHIVQPGLALYQRLLPPDFGHPVKALAYKPGRKAEGEVEPENQRGVPLSPRYQPGEEPLEVPAILKKDELVPDDLGEPGFPPTAVPGARPIDRDSGVHVHAPLLLHPTSAAPEST